MSKTITVSISIHKTVKDDLDVMSKDLGLTISKLARNLIYTSLDDYKVLKVFGISKQVLAFRSSCKTLDPLDNSSSDDSQLNDFVQISVILDTDIKTAIEKYSSQLGIPFKSFARNLIYIGLKDVKFLRKIGAYKIALAFEKLVNSYFGSTEDKSNSDKD